MRRRGHVMAVVGVVVAVAAMAWVWEAMHPSPRDPKSIGYVLWKAGLYRADLAIVTGTMIGDPKRDELVVGKTKAQLRARFGELLTTEDASSYFRWSHEASSWKGRTVLFLPGGPWMIVFEGDTASQLVLLKGG
jgi:hypothetical protein